MEKTKIKTTAKKLMNISVIVVFSLFLLLGLAEIANSDQPYQSQTARLEADLTGLHNARAELERQIESKTIDLARSKIADQLVKESPDYGEVSRLSSKLSDMGQVPPSPTSEDEKKN